MKAELLAILILSGFALYLFIRWLRAPRQTSDPWGQDVEQTLQDPDAEPVCPHCLTPQHHNGWFCPECGSTVGQFSNYLPFVYPFSIGDAMRAGVTGGLWKRPIILTGYILIALGYFTILAPIYIALLFIRIARNHELAAPTHEPGGTA